MSHEFAKIWSLETGPRTSNLTIDVAVTVLVVVLLVGALFARALGARDGRSSAAAAVVGLIFAVHPLHVESVAWVSERKDLLCGVFYVLAMLSYLRFAEQAPVMPGVQNDIS